MGHNMDEQCENCGVTLEEGQIGACDACLDAPDDQGNLSNAKTRKMVVLCQNSEGSPEFHTCAVVVTPKEAEEGRHYELAKENASFNGYDEPMIAFDAGDAAGKQLGEVLAWL